MTYEGSAVGSSGRIDLTDDEVGNILITGRPGSGKTTLMRKVVERLPGGLDVDGFLTLEIREEGRRVGFLLAPFEGPRRVLAHVDVDGPRVSRYGVDVDALDEVVARTLERPAGAWVVDEIGKMECMSERFVAAMSDVLDSARPTLATVARRGGGLIAAAKERDDARVLEVDTDNRDELVEPLSRWLRGRLDPGGKQS